MILNDKLDTCFKGRLDIDQCTSLCTPQAMQVRLLHGREISRRWRCCCVCHYDSITPCVFYDFLCAVLWLSLGVQKCNSATAAPSLAIAATASNARVLTVWCQNIKDIQVRREKIYMQASQCIKSSAWQERLLYPVARAFHNVFSVRSYLQLHSIYHSFLGPLGLEFRPRNKSKWTHGLTPPHPDLIPAAIATAYVCSVRRL